MGFLPKRGGGATGFGPRGEGGGATSSRTRAAQECVCSTPERLSSARRPGVPTTSRGLFSFMASACRLPHTLPHAPLSSHHVPPTHASHSPPSAWTPASQPSTANAESLHVPFPLHLSPGKTTDSTNCIPFSPKKQGEKKGRGECKAPWT